MALPDTKPASDSLASSVTDTVSGTNEAAGTRPGDAEHIVRIQQMQKRQRVEQCRRSLEELSASLKRANCPERYIAVTRETVQKALDRLAELEETIIK